MADSVAKRLGIDRIVVSVGAIAMNLSTIIVAFNAQLLLRRLRLGH
jgi:cation transport ATPase